MSLDWGEAIHKYVIILKYLIHIKYEMFIKHFILNVHIKNFPP